MTLFAIDQEFEKMYNTYMIHCSCNVSKNGGIRSYKSFFPEM